jgi:hypothetical protein
MFEKVKECLKEVISIADKCPEKYQKKCFEVLLSSLVRPEGLPIVTVAGAPAIAKTDFFSNYDISEKEWQRVFYFDGTSYSIIVKDLKEKRGKAPKQVKLALLLGIKELLNTGEAAVSKESLVEFCKNYAAHDVSNFAGNMKRSKDLFSTKGDGWVLTVPGQDKAAEVIKELAQ